jgi:hypothetical protein
MSFEQDGKEILVPTVINGRVVSDDEAIAAYRKTGQHLGIFSSPAAATAFGQALHQREESGQGSQPPVPSARPAGFVPDGFVPDTPDFRASNATDDQGSPIVAGASKAWQIGNTPLIPQIADAAHAIATYMSKPSMGDQRLNDRIPGLGTVSAALRGGAAGMVEGAGDLASGFTSPIGIALTLAGLGGEGAAARAIPGLKGILELPAVRSLQRAAQAVGGGAFAAHGAGEVVNAPTIGGKARGVVEVATGALGATSALRAGQVTRPAAAVAPDAAAIEWAQAHGIPVDAGTATGNLGVKGAQFMADRTLAGSIVAKRAHDATAAALTREGETLAGQSRGAAITAEEAGQGIRDALGSKRDAHSSLADAAYDRLRALEKDPKHQRQVRTGTKSVQTVTPTDAVDAGGQPVMQTVTTRVPVIETIGMPVDTRAAKASLRPVVEQMERQLPPTQQQANPGLKALRNILDGPDYASLSQVDRDLSAIKAIARQHGGLAKLGVKTLEAAVQAAAARGGSTVVEALGRGRRATIGKVTTEAVIDALPGGKMEEPRAVFSRATAPHDSGIEFLRAIKTHTPQALPQIARAKLDELFSTGTQEGGFGHTDKLYADWKKMGAETKAVLYPEKGQVAALEHFFLVAKRLNENVNPSGTAQGVMRLSEGGALVTNPLAFIAGEVGAAGLSTILHSRAGVKALTRLLSASRPAAATSTATLRTAARAASWAEVVQAARAVGVPLTASAATTEDRR